MPTLLGSFTRIDLADGVLVAMADDTTVRVCAAPSPDVERLTADVARLVQLARRSPPWEAGLPAPVSRVPGGV